MIFEATKWLEILKDVVDIIQSNHTKDLEAKKYELASTVYTDFTNIYDSSSIYYDVDDVDDWYTTIESYLDIIKNYLEV
jgi:hypothetical protein